MGVFGLKFCTFRPKFSDKKKISRHFSDTKKFRVNTCPRLLPLSRDATDCCCRTRCRSDARKSPTPSVDMDDVFNDIDTMFQGLAQELDEMLTLQDT